MNMNARDRSNLFIGVVDRSKYQVEQLISTYWKDSPSSFYWDIWNGKLTKVDENGVQVGSISGYGCTCQSSENVTIIGMLYDPKKQTLTYYKNKLKQGIAFHNVPSNMYPAIDLWFESGHVEIEKTSIPNGIIC